MTTEAPIIESMLVLCEFLDVFPVALPRLPAERKVNFMIEVETGTMPISIPPYQIAPIEHKELSTQLQSLLDLGFIRPSVSPKEFLCCL